MSDFKPVKMWDCLPLDLIAFEADLAAAALATEDPDAPLNAGEWCRFCKAAAVCPENRRRNLEAAQASFPEIAEDGEVKTDTVAKLSPARMAAVLKEADTIGNWVKAVQAYAHNEAMNGNPIPGFKLVEKRATRRWKNPEDIAATLDEAGLSAEEIWAEPKLRSPAQLEKVVGRAAFEAFGEHVEKASSGLNLVPEDDKRPAAKQSAVDQFSAA
jgi:hypothetical protein